VEQVRGTVRNERVGWRVRRDRETRASGKKLVLRCRIEERGASDSLYFVWRSFVVLVLRRTPGLRHSVVFCG